MHRVRVPKERTQGGSLRSCRGGRAALQYLAGGAVGFFLVLLLWGHASGVRQSFTTLERQLDALQLTLDQLQSQVVELSRQLPEHAPSQTMTP